MSVKIILQKEDRTNHNRSKFRKLARDVCREVFDIPEKNQVIFAYEKHYSKTILIGEISFQLCDLSINYPGNSFDDEYYNVITFMFIKEDFQLQGIGRKLVKEALRQIQNHDCVRTIRVQSAEGAVGFFEKLGFVKIGNPIETICGVSLFKKMQNMELKNINLV